MRLGRLILFFLFLHLHPAIAQQRYDPAALRQLKDQTFRATVIRIIDGDTMEVLYKGKAVKIRLAHIDCPEKRRSQPFGNTAKKALSDLCFRQTVTVYGEQPDRYGRLIAVILNYKKQNVNQEMIKQGMAWHFKKYSKDPVYAHLEIEARKRKVGLWKDAHPIAPWKWRKPKRRIVREVGEQDPQLMRSYSLEDTEPIGERMRELLLLKERLLSVNI